MSFSNFAIEAGVNSAKPAEPAGSDPTKPAPASGPTSVPSTTPGKPAAPAPQTNVLDDDADLGFGDAPDTDDGTGGDDDGSAPAAEPVPLGPPSGATKQEIADWRETNGIPNDPTGYQPPSGTAWNNDALAPILAAVHAHNVPQQAVADALEVYGEQIAKQQANLQKQDKARLAEVKTKLTPSERTAVDAASSAMSPDLRRAMRQARLPTGELLLHNQEFLSLIAGLNKRGSGSTTPVTRAQDDAAREAEIRQLMRSDFEAYRKSGAAEELSAIMRRRGAA